MEDEEEEKENKKCWSRRKERMRKTRIWTRTR
jgi:hypothetical protein